MSDSELSTAPPESITLSVTPWTKAKSTGSGVSSRPPAHKTRNFATRKGIVEPQQRKKRRITNLPTLERSDPMPHHSATPSEDPEDDESIEREQFETSTQSISQASSTSGGRIKRSHIHKHFNTVTDDVSGQERWQCKYCSMSYKPTGSTTVCDTHLRSKHNVNVMRSQDAREARLDNNIEEAFRRQPNKQTQILGAQELDQNILEYLYLRWTINANISFKNTRPEDFRTLLQYINPIANLLLPCSDTTLHTRAQSLFREGQKRLVHYLHSALTSTHISCDLWTSSNSLGILAVVSHFVDESGILQTILLSLTEIQGSHSGENQAQIVHNTLVKYDIRNRVGYFVMDNADNNETLMQHLASKFQADGIFICLASTSASPTPLAVGTPSRKP